MAKDRDEIEIKGERRKPMKVGTRTTVDMATGEVTEVERNAGVLLPPRGDVCQECAVDHVRDEPHNRDSLYYQMQFHATHGRWPEWRDALAHCPEEIKRAWIRELMRCGVTAEQCGASEGFAGRG